MTLFLFNLSSILTLNELYEVEKMNREMWMRNHVYFAVNLLNDHNHIILRFF